MLIRSRKIDEIFPFFKSNYDNSLTMLNVYVINACRIQSANVEFSQVKS